MIAQSCKFKMETENLLSQSAFSVRLIFHPLPERMSVVSVHVDLTEEVELGIVTFSKLLNIGFGTGLLRGGGREGTALKSYRC